jgi:hypothetical protein
MNYTITLSLLFLSIITNAQDKINWDGTYQLQLSDFQSPGTQVGSGNTYTVHPASGFDFAIQMSNYEFMFTKNFNSKINNSFSRDASIISAPDSAIAFQLLNFARYQFDLSELYARKFRRKLYEQKSAFSNITFVQPAFNEIHREYAERYTAAGNETELGKDAEKLAAIHQAVKDEIAGLPDYCKTCKPAKKKK